MKMRPEYFVLTIEGQTADELDANITARLRLWQKASTPFEVLSVAQSECCVDGMPHITTTLLCRDISEYNAMMLEARQ